MESKQEDCIAKFQGHFAYEAWNQALAWTPDGKQLLSAGTHVVHHKDLGFVDLEAGRVCCVAFSMDGKYILSGGKIILSQVGSTFARGCSQDQATDEDTLKEHAANNVSSCSLLVSLLIDPQSRCQCSNPDCEILAINTTARDACIAGDLLTADKLLTQDIAADDNDYKSHANRSFVKARNSDWDHALDDALKSISIKPSLMGCISKGIAHCGKKQFRDAMKAFDIAFMHVDADLNKTRLLLLIKAIALFNANQHDEAILRVQELATTRPNPNSLACGVVEAYLHVQLGKNASHDARHNEAAGHFTAAVNTIDFSSVSAIHSRYDVFVVLFGWDLRSLWRNAHQNWCDALLRAGRLPEAIKAYRYMMDRADEATKARCLDWSTGESSRCKPHFKQDCNVVYAADGVTDLAVGGDEALAAGNYDKAIELYSAAIDLDFATHTTFANRSKARSGKMLWNDALLDAEKVIELDPSSYFGYQLKHAVLHGAHRYDEAIEALSTMLSKLESAPDTETRNLRQQSARQHPAPSNQHLHWALMQPRGTDQCLQNKHSVQRTFVIHHETSGLSNGAHQDVVSTYFRYVMLSHRWEVTEPSLHDIQNKVVYDLDPIGGIAKLQSFCRTARDKGYCWAWIDTCCIDQTNNVEVQQSVNSMFLVSPLSTTIIYLSDVPLRRSLALAAALGIREDGQFKNSGFNVCTLLPEGLVVEMGDVTGIDARTLVAFRPGMRNAREKLQWVSARVTTWPEDIAYSLFGIFGVNLPVIYGEKKQKALGRLLQEVIAQSGDISALDWVGNHLNSIAVYQPTLLHTKHHHFGLFTAKHRGYGISFKALYPSRSDERSSFRELQTASALHSISCHGSETESYSDQDSHSTYQVKADGLHDLSITTEDKLIPSSWTFSTRQTFLLVRPWDRDLLELPDFAELLGLAARLPDIGDDTQSEESYWSAPGSPLQDSPGGSLEAEKPVDLESGERALRLIVRLGQRFSAFLLAQQRGGEYRESHQIVPSLHKLTTRLLLRTWWTSRYSRYCS
ncbi:uncharacterized protein HD556DRAFT_1528372 [Suillus plorans]|uniref:Heterokaryon incompatibility domain-containing protein n=1 Tax=Suillus plorans TaxID=116603 RepID=A0A9P7DGD0_9AGAM|nr:uncharacterized protein HD556DRAFT_1528372 [Suillus plorans]KAG1791519.1 hypothetical protein HD556DRAFT_1528372 [Suillus plorans]